MAWVQRNRTRTLLASAARTTHPTATVQTNTDYLGVKVFINISAFSGTSITFTLAEKGSIADVYTTVLASAALTGTGQVVLTVYPGIAVTANVSASTVLGRNWKITPTGTITSVTYSVAYLELP